MSVVRRSEGVGDAAEVHLRRIPACVVGGRAGDPAGLHHVRGDPGGLLSRDGCGLQGVPLARRRAERQSPPGEAPCTRAGYASAGRDSGTEQTYQTTSPIRHTCTRAASRTAFGRHSYQCTRLGDVLECSVHDVPWYSSDACDVLRPGVPTGRRSSACTSTTARPRSRSA